MTEQMSLFGFPADAQSPAPRRKTAAARRRRVRVQCRRCGHWFLAYRRGVNCDDCIRIERDEQREERTPVRYGFVFHRQAPEFYDPVTDDEFPRGF